MTNYRLCINTCDVMILTGDSLRKAQRELSLLRKALNKKPHQRITFKEYSEYADIPLEEIMNRLFNK